MNLAARESIPAFDLLDELPAVPQSAGAPASSKILAHVDRPS